MKDETGPKMDQINLVVRDMDAAVAFYRRLGLVVRDSGDAWDQHHRNVTGAGGLDFDIDSTEFACMWSSGWTEGRTGAVVTFRQPDRASVDQAFGDLIKAGYTEQQAPYDAFWGARFAIVEDPDGNSVGLMSPADADHRSPGPNPPS